MSNRRIRGAGLLLVISALWYGPWLLTRMNVAAAWLAIPFAAANLLIIATTLLALINNWQRTAPAECPTPDGAEPTVAVMIPTCGEPAAMVERTARSVLSQDWPADRLRVVISDDARAAEIAAVAARLQAEFPAAIVVGHEPPPRGAPERRGEAKAGNLNSALQLVNERFPDATFVETRDADDEVGDRGFLRQCVGQLQADGRLAFVQTVKEVRVSPGDPFGNAETLFYRGSMLARNAANAVFPCGSGLVWRATALADIGGFPTWNLVEDLQSGVEALRRGWRGVYLPIVGAVGQTAPEDIPNVYKQRGTWALDTMRLLLWGNLGGLNLRQRLHFVELGLFYLHGLAIMAFTACLAISLAFGVYPLTTDQFSYALHFWPFAAAVELFLAALNGRQPYEALLRARQMWIGLAPIYAKACLLALVNGPRRKPVYRVTRKTHRFGWYWRETLVQTGLIVMMAAAMLYGLVTTPLLTEYDLGSAYWVAFFTTLLGGFVRKSWHGVDWRRRATFALGERSSLGGRRLKVHAKRWAPPILALPVAGALLVPLDATESDSPTVVPVGIAGAAVPTGGDGGARAHASPAVVKAGLPAAAGPRNAASIGAVLRSGRGGRTGPLVGTRLSPTAAPATRSGSDEACPPRCARVGGIAAERVGGAVANLRGPARRSAAHEGE